MTGVVLLVFAALCVAFGCWIAVTGGRIVILAGQEVRLRNLGRFSMYGVVALGAALAISARSRAALRGPAGSLAAAALVAAVGAFFLSLGPRMETGNEFIGHGPYALLLKFVPGYDGLRVPSRFAMIVVLSLAVAAGYVGALMAKRRWGRMLVLLLAGIAVAESRPIEFAVDAPSIEVYENAPLAFRHRMKGAAPLYDELRRLPRGVLLEVPWGTVGWDLQYMHAQRVHGWPLVNGYSGHFPEGYTRTSMITHVFEGPDRAWWGLERSGASHVLVHEWAFRSIDRGARVSQWLRDGGAVEVASTQHDRLFRLPGGIQHR